MIHYQNINLVRILFLFFFVSCKAQQFSSNYSFIEFSRYLFTCDESFDLQFSSNFQNNFKRGNSIIWATGEFNQNQNIINLQGHTNNIRGNKVVNLFESFNNSHNENKLFSSETFNNSETFQINLSIDPILISSPTATRYHCQAFELPYFSSKPHIIQFQPIINQSNAEYIHHVFLYYCSSDLSSAAMAYRGDCFNPSQPRELMNCNLGRIIYGWTVGGVPLSLPAETGIPLNYGAGQRNFISLEIHYNNPNHDIFVDSSGIQMTLTYKLRKFDSAVAIIERNVGSFRIPAHQNDYKIQSYCPEECTKSSIPSSGIYIYANLFHAHLAARNFQLQHIRNKTELEPIDTQDNFNFNFQRTAIFPKPSIVLPGDELILTCGYNTMDRISDVGSGLDTTLEMCVAYVFYYRTDIDNHNHTGSKDTQDNLIPYLNDCRSGPEVRLNNVMNIFCSHLDRGHRMNPNSGKIINPFNSLKNQFQCLNPPNVSYSTSNHDSGMIKGNYLSSYEILSHLNEYSYSSWLDRNHKEMKLFWNLTMVYDSNNTIINGIISFAILSRIKSFPSSSSTGSTSSNWFGIGLSPSGDMINSDIYIGIIEENSKLVLLSDRFATQHSLPLIDSKQDLFNIQGGIVSDYMNREDSLFEDNHNHNNIYKSMDSVIPLYRCEKERPCIAVLVFPTISSTGTVESKLNEDVSKQQSSAVSMINWIIIIISLFMFFSLVVLILRKVVNHYHYKFRYSALQSNINTTRSSASTTNTTGI